MKPFEKKDSKRNAKAPAGAKKPAGKEAKGMPFAKGGRAKGKC